MAEITAQLVKELRETTGAGMMDCKRALEEAGGDLERSIDILRTKGLSKAAKKAERVASEGAVGLALKKHGAGMTGAAVELNAETDFVARNELFQGAVRHAAEAALEAGEAIEAINAHKTSTGQTVSEVVTHLIATIGENMLLRRAAVFTVEKGVVAAYAHNAIAPNIGRIGVLVAVEGEGDQQVLQEMGKDIALHIAAFNPLSLSVDDLDPAAVERERAIFAEQAAGSGKPANVIEKMVEGRLRKFYEEVVLLKQAFAKNSDITVEQLVAETAKKVGSPVKVAGFVRLALGEGVEKVAGPDLASEVASMIAKS